MSEHQFEYVVAPSSKDGLSDGFEVIGTCLLCGKSAGIRGHAWRGKEQALKLASKYVPDALLDIDCDKQH